MIQYHHLQSYTIIICYNLLYFLRHSNLKVKKSTPSLFSQSVVGQFTPQW